MHLHIPQLRLSGSTASYNACTSPHCENSAKFKHHAPTHPHCALGGPAVCLGLLLRT
jgi:hypothetical protein